MCVTTVCGPWHTVFPGLCSKPEIPIAIHVMGPLIIKSPVNVFFF